MDEFFNNRIEGYESHQLNVIVGTQASYSFTAEVLSMGENARILDLGCGIGLELSYYFARNPSAKVTCIDLAEKLLGVLREKFPDKGLTIVRGSYFDVPFGKGCYDAVLSVESPHHFPQAGNREMVTKR